MKQHMRELVSQKTLGCAGENAVQKQVVGADPRAGLQREGISRRAELHGAAQVLPSGERRSELPERERAKRFVAEDATDKGRRGPGRVAVIDGRVSMYLPSQTGALVSAHATTRVGQPIPSGPVAWMVNPGTGERVEEFSAPEEGAILMLVRSSPSMVNPGDFGAVVAWPARETVVPNT